MGMYLGADLGVGYYIWHSMIPVCLGNIVGGGLFVGVAHWYMFLYRGGTEGTSVGAPGFLSRVLTGQKTTGSSSRSSDNAIPLAGQETQSTYVNSARPEKMV